MMERLVLLWVAIAVWVGVELIYAILGAKIECLSGVIACGKRRLRVDHHSTNWVSNHVKCPLSSNKVQG